jgi:PAS domain S-box-containing protein
MITVLYVDPDAGIRDEVSAFFQSDPEIKIHTLGSAYEALDLIKQRRFDVIVSDVILPITNGQAFLEVLRRERKETIPFIFFARRTSHATVIEALNAGATFFLLKGSEPKKAYPLLKYYIGQAVQQHRTEEELVRSEKRYRAVVEDQTELICRFLPDGTHVFVNDAYCRFFKKERSAILGSRFTPGYSPEDKKRIYQHLLSLTPENPVAGMTNRIESGEGEERFVFWNNRAIFDGTGTLIEYQSVGRDITDQKTAERALLVARNNLGIMNSITRHDILNQLTSVFGYLGFSLASCTDPVMREYLKKALSAAETIQSQILFTRDYQDIGSAAPQWQNMEQVFTKTAGTLNLDGIAVETSLKDLWVCADPLIEKVFFNLLENSLRHGGKISKVRVFSHETDDGLVIIYEDNGVGVPSGAKEKIFRREYFQNTGLGLYLSREILAITNMVITETGTEGNGVRFEISVPKGMYGKRIEENSPCIATRGRGIPQ